MSPGEHQPIIRFEEVRLLGQRGTGTTSFSIESGEFVVVAGGSGSEKSLLIQTAAGLRHPALGKVALFGIDTERLRQLDYPAMRRRTGFVFSEPVFIQGLSAVENVLLPLRYDDELEPQEMDRRAREALDAAGYTGKPDALPEDLSPLNRRKAILARAWARSPEIVFYDDPTSALDPVSRSEFYRIAHNYHAKRRSGDPPLTTVLACNDPRGVLEYADRFFLIQSGVLTSCADKKIIRTRQASIEKEFFESIEVA